MTRFENEVSRTNLKVVRISEMGIFWCICIKNNVEVCQQFNDKAQTANFSVLARGRQPCQELFPKIMENWGK